MAAGRRETLGFLAAFQLAGVAAMLGADPAPSAEDLNPYGRGPKAVTLPVVATERSTGQAFRLMDDFFTGGRR